MGTFIQNHLTYRAEQGTSNCPHSTTDIKKLNKENELTEHERDKASTEAIQNRPILLWWGNNGLISEWKPQDEPIKSQKRTKFWEKGESQRLYSKLPLIPLFTIPYITPLIIKVHWMKTRERIWTMSALEVLRTPCRQWMGILPTMFRTSVP